MLDSLRIENFRKFNCISFNSLGKINLLIGKNGSGKTTVLEAIRLYAASATSELLETLLSSRQELTYGPQLAGGTSLKKLNYVFKNLFHGRKFPELGLPGIYIGEVDNSNNSITIKPEAYYRDIKEDKEGYSYRDLFIDHIPNNIKDFEYSLRITRHNKDVEHIPMNRERGDRYPVFRRRDSYIKKMPLRHVPSNTLSPDNIAYLWDTIVFSRREKDVINALRIIDNNIERISFIDNKSHGSERVRTAVVKLKNKVGPIPLASLGDGIQRIFQIIISLVTPSNSYLTIDEFENGLHWTAQELLWKMIFDISIKLKIQVFATTHSNDCIEGFIGAWHNHKSAGKLFRLGSGKYPDKITEIDYHSASSAIQENVEIR